MKIRINGNNKVLSNSEIRSYIKWLGMMLMSKRLLKNIFIDVNIKTLKGAKATACFVDDRRLPREFEIELSLKLGRNELLKALAHEMVHVKQYATGELFQYSIGGAGHRYQGKKYSANMEYYDCPWEIEAYGREVGLYRLYLQQKQWFKHHQKKNSS